MPSKEVKLAERCPHVRWTGNKPYIETVLSILNVEYIDSLSYLEAEKLSEYHKWIINR